MEIDLNHFSGTIKCKNEQKSETFVFFKRERERERKGVNGCLFVCVCGRIKVLEGANMYKGESCINLITTAVVRWRLQE